MKPSEAVKILERLCAFYPRAEMPPETVAAYASIMVELDRADCAAGCEMLVRSSTFLPSAAEIINATRTVRRERLAASRAAIVQAENAEHERIAIPPPPAAIKTMKHLGITVGTASHKRRRIG